MKNAKRLMPQFLVASALAVIASSVVATPAIAQAAADDAADDGSVIIVTARKRAESAQDVPISLTALSDDDLRENNVFGLEDVAQSTPGLTYSDAAGVASPVIRGLSQTDLSSFVNNVGVFVDGVFLNSRSSLEFGNLDLQRVEVLKGPQSALYGRDTFAGAINYVTRAPDVNKFSGYVQGDVGSHDRGGVKASVNIPIKGFAGLRLFGGRSRFGGTIKNTRGGENLGGYDKRQTYGASLLIQPVEGMKIKAFYVRNEVSEDQPPLVVIPATANTGGSTLSRTTAGVTTTFRTLYAGAVPTFDSVNLDPRGFGNDGYLDLGYVETEFELPVATVTLNYSKSKSKYRTQFDNSGSLTAATVPIVPGSRFSNFFFTNQSGDAASQDSLEAKIQSPADSKFFWMIGGSYHDTKTGSITSSIASLLANPAQLERITNVASSLRFQTSAYYAAATIPIAGKLNLGGEIRYTDEKQQLTGVNQIFFLPFPTTTTNLGTNFDYWTGRASVDYKINPDILAYAYAAKGLKTGGVNLVAATSPFLRFGPESNWTYELGLKSSLFNGRAIFNVALYYIDWKNVQVRAPATLTTAAVVVNGSGASSKGVELDATFRVTNNFTVRGALSYNDPKFDNGFIDGSFNAACALPPPAAPTVVVNACSTNVGGNQLPRTSKFQFFGSAAYELPNLFEDFAGYIRADFSHRDSQTSTSLNLDSTGAIDLANLRLGVKNGQFDVAVWVDNVFDASYNTRVLAITATGLPAGFAGTRATNLYPGNGRTFGATALFRF